MPQIVFNGLTYQVSNEEAQTVHDLMEKVIEGVEPGFSLVLPHRDSAGEVAFETSHKRFVSRGAPLTIVDWP